MIQAYFYKQPKFLTSYYKPRTSSIMKLAHYKTDIQNSQQINSSLVQDSLSITKVWSLKFMLNFDLNEQPKYSRKSSNSTYIHKQNSALQVLNQHQYWILNTVRPELPLVTQLSQLSCTIASTATWIISDKGTIVHNPQYNGSLNIF